MECSPLSLTREDEASVRAHLIECSACREALDRATDEPDLACWARRVNTPSAFEHEAELARLVLSLEHDAEPGEVATVRIGAAIALGPPRVEGDLGSLGRYRIVNELGSGGLGVVLKGYDEKLGRPVAIKLLYPDRVDGDTHRHLAREARHAARFRHDNVVVVYAVEETTEGIPFIVMEYIPGPSVAELLRERTRLDPREAAELIAQAAEGLAAAHAAGLIHRDVKPANILVDPDRGRARIVDFGLAFFPEAPGSIADSTLVGTPSYMSPEQARGHGPMDARTDQYSLGASLYELLTGEPPFRGTPAMVVHQVLEDDPRPPRKLSEAVPRDLETICLKTLAKDPGRRYPTTALLAADLRRWLRGEPITARPVGVMGRIGKWARRRPAAAALISVTLLAVMALLASSLAYSARVTAAYQRAEQHRHDAESRRREADAQRREADSRRALAQALARDLRREVYVKDMGRAQQIWKQGAAARALALLEKYRPKPDEEDLRGFEWYYLWRRARDQGRRLIGHLGAVRHVAASPDGQLVATAGADGKIQLWDTATWKIRASLRGHKKGVNWVVFAPDGNELASASEDGTVRLWNLRSLEERTLANVDGAAAAAVYLPDGQTVAVATERGRIALLETQSGATRWAFDRPGPVKSLAVSPDAKEMAITFNSTAPTERWDLTQTPPTALGELLPRDVVQYSRDGRTLIVGTETGDLEFLPRMVPRPSRERRLRLSSRRLDAVAESPDGRTVAAAGVQGVIHLVDDRDIQDEREPCIGHRDRIGGITWLPKGDALVSASDDWSVRVWSPQASQSGEALWEMANSDFLLNKCTHALKFSPDGRQLWFHTSEAVWSIELATRRLTRRLIAESATDGLYDAAYALEPGRERVLICSKSGSREVWDVTTRRIIFRVPTDAEQRRRLRGTHAGLCVYLADLSEDGRQVAAPDPGGEIRIWNVATGRETRRLSKRYANPVLRAHFSPDGRQVAVAHFDGVDLFDAATGAEMAVYRDSLPQVFSPDSRFALQEVTGRIERFRLVRVDQLRGRELDLPKMVEQVVAITHDGRTFATYVSNTELRLWNTETGQPMFTLANHGRERCLAAAFSADDTMLAALVYNAHRVKVLLWRAGAFDSTLHFSE